MQPYREHPPPPGLQAHVACLWTSHDGAVLVLPDGCVDVVISGGRLLVAGPATAATTVPATPGQPRGGVRFRIGSAGSALAVPAGDLRDEEVDLTELWGRAAARLRDRVAAEPTIHAAVATLARGLAERLPGPRDGDPLVRAAVLSLHESALPHAGDPLPLAGIARRVGLGERQLRRRFERAVGYGPATLVRVQRFQRFLHLAQGHPRTPLARLAAEAGYADQAHLTRECRRLSGLPAARLRAAGATAAGERSETFKPDAAGQGRLGA